jgi:hypothetical protein
MKKKIILLFSVFAIFLSLGIALKVKASLTDNTKGWIWSGSEDANLGPIDGIINGNETGLGWVSANNINCDANDDGISDGAPAGCPATGTSMAKYGINIPTGNGPVTGYVWSSNLGWIDFNSCGSCITPDGIANSGVSRDLKFLKGWARVVGIANEYTAGNSGGWQGWIKMNGTTTTGETYGILLNDDGTINACSNGNKSCAWNGEEAGTGGNIASGLGWIDFSKMTTDANKFLKICQDSCNSGNRLAYKNIDVGTTVKLKVCYNGEESNCYDSTGTADVTGSTSWTIVDPNNAIEIDSVNPDYIVRGKTAEKSAALTAQYSGKSANVTILVNCAITPGYCDDPVQANLRKKTCRGASFKDNCGGYSCECKQADCKDCTGWKELGR